MFKIKVLIVLRYIFMNKIILWNYTTSLKYWYNFLRYIKRYAFMMKLFVIYYIQKDKLESKQLTLVRFICSFACYIAFVLQIYVMSQCICT